MVDRKICISCIEKLLNSWVKERCHMVKGIDEEAAYTSMLYSLCSTTYEGLEEFKSELKKMKILGGSCREYPAEKTWKVDHDFLIDHMKNSHVGSMDWKDEVLAKKLDRKLREDQQWIDALRREDLDSTVRFK